MGVIDAEMVMAEFRRLEIELNCLLRQVGRSRDGVLAEKFYQKMRSMAGQSKRVRDIIEVEKRLASVK